MLRATPRRPVRAPPKIEEADNVEEPADHPAGP
jgi:hypothetical protein